MQFLFTLVIEINKYHPDIFVLSSDHVIFTMGSVIGWKMSLHCTHYNNHMP